MTGRICFAWAGARQVKRTCRGRDIVTGVVGNSGEPVLSVAPEEIKNECCE